VIAMAKTIVVRLTTRLDRRLARLARAWRTTPSETARRLLAESLPGVRCTVRTSPR